MPILWSMQELNSYVVALGIYPVAPVIELEPEYEFSWGGFSFSSRGRFPKLNLWVFYYSRILVRLIPFFWLRATISLKSRNCDSLKEAISCDWNILFSCSLFWLLALDFGCVWFLICYPLPISPSSSSPYITKDRSEPKRSIESSPGSEL